MSSPVTITQQNRHSWLTQDCFEAETLSYPNDLVIHTTGTKMLLSEHEAKLLTLSDRQPKAGLGGGIWGSILNGIKGSLDKGNIPNLR